MEVVKEYDKVLNVRQRYQAIGLVPAYAFNRFLFYFSFSTIPDITNYATVDVFDVSVDYYAYLVNRAYVFDKVLFVFDPQNDDEASSNARFLQGDPGDPAWGIYNSGGGLKPGSNSKRTFDALNSSPYNLMILADTEGYVQNAAQELFLTVSFNLGLKKSTI
jgi:hypothetical protein